MRPREYNNPKMRVAGYKPPTDGTIAYCVYGIISLQGECLYIGATEKVCARAQYHRNRFPYGCIMQVLHQVSTAAEARVLEQQEINSRPNLQNASKVSTYPKYNYQHQSVRDERKRRAIENTMADPAFL